MPVLAASVLLVAAALAVSACGSSSAQNCGGVQGAVLVKMSEYKFDPSAVQLKAGRTTLCLANTGNMAHDLSIMQGGKVVAKSDQVAPGDSGKFNVDLRAGSYKIECDLPGHAQQGMTGSLEVTG